MQNISYVIFRLLKRTLIMQNYSLNDIQRTKIRAVTCFAKNIKLKSVNNLKDPNIFSNKSKKRKISLVSTLNK